MQIVYFVLFFICYSCAVSLTNLAGSLCQSNVFQSDKICVTLIGCFLLHIRKINLLDCYGCDHMKPSHMLKNDLLTCPKTESYPRLKTYAAISNAHLFRVCKRGKMSGSCLSTLNGFGSTQLPIFLCHIGVPTFCSQNN